jgi:hypothetical protein
LGEPFRAALFLVVRFSAAGFLAAGFVREDDFFEPAFRFLATAVPLVTTAPMAAALAAARSGFSATVEATFFASDPTADAASPALSVTVSIGDWASDRFFASFMISPLHPALS